MDNRHIRNFCIIAHIDHGKSTLADRFLEITGTISKRDMKEQVLDSMDLERERGITIKLQPARMEMNFAEGKIHPEVAHSDRRISGEKYALNLIDTPGHVDFTYEVSRSLAACEGALLVVDATQGIEAQTLSNLYLAVDQGLEIIPVINKIDLPNARPDRVRDDLVNLLGCKPSEVLMASAKTGQGVQEILEAVIERIPAPKNTASNPFRALIFDSVFDEYKGVVAYVRVMDGTIAAEQPLHFLSTNVLSAGLEVGVFRPRMEKCETLSAGEVGYIVTGLKDVEQCKVGDTIAAAHDLAPLPGYKEVKPMVFAGLFCQDGSDYARLREAMQKLKLNDAALQFEPEHSTALGFGFRSAFLGLLHLEVVQERLKREYGLDLIVTVPSVAYTVYTTRGNVETITSPIDLPDPSTIDRIEEPWVAGEMIVPKEYVGNIMTLAQEKRGAYQGMEYLDQSRVILRYHFPLAGILVDFYDKLKSASSGYASFNYDFVDYREADVVRMDILVAAEVVEALASIVYRDEADRIGRGIVKRLKDVLPRQMFEVRLQAAIGGRIIASERIPAMRKDVTAKLYGGDVTRKRKLLEKQKRGKKRMRAQGRVDIPQEAFLSILKRD
ncbi:MAG: elongation factor 4 [Candidatus Kerfeldbacteria bacterium]|nr:elongation factor 4 [Candidatus Kerfeldbacteria bacterium]